MKHFGALSLLVGLVALTIWWQWPDRGRWNYWFAGDRIVTIAGCRQGQLTTLSDHESRGRSAVALNEVAALAIFEKPTSLFETFAPGKLEQGLADIPKRVKQFFTLIRQGQVLRIPESKLVRYVQPSKFAKSWIVDGDW